MRRGEARRSGHGRAERRLWQAAAGVSDPDFLSETDSVLVCLLTTTQRAAPLYRLSLPSGAGTGLRAPSQVMVDKIMAVRRDRCGALIGRIDDAARLVLNRLLAVVVGVAD